MGNLPRKLPNLDEADRRQMEIEEEAVSSTFDFLKRQDARLQDRDRASVSHSGRAAIKRLLAPATAALEISLAAARSGRPGRRNAAVVTLGDATAEECAEAALKVLVDSCNRPQRFQSVGLKIGRAILIGRAMRNWEAENKARVAALKRKHASHNSAHLAMRLRETALADGADFDLPPLPEIFKAGAWVLWHVIEAGVGFEAVREENKVKNQTLRVAPTEKFLEWLKKHNGFLSETRPQTPPLVVPPLDWAPDADGGYHYALRRASTFILNASRKRSRAIRETCGPAPFAAINHLQKTEWRVNKPLLAVYRAAIMEGGHVGGLPGTRAETVPPHPVGSKYGDDPSAQWTPEEMAAHTRWKAQALLIHDRNAETARKRLRELRTMTLAEQMAEEERFWLAWAFDSRGRMYPHAPHLGPQGRDPARALLEFAEGEHLSAAGERALALHLVARLGKDPKTGAAIDKLPIADRLQWVRENYLRIVTLAASPFVQRWWEQADDPWQFLAACMAWQDKCHGRPVHLPIQQDGTCNGYQHLAAMTRSPQLGRAVNLTAGTLRPEDIYLEVALEAIRESPGKLPLTRKAAKDPVMTAPMGAALISMADGLMEHVPPGLDEKEARKTALEMAKALRSALKRLYPGLDEARGFLKAASRACAEEGLELSWRGPSGFPVTGDYRKTLTDRSSAQVAATQREVRFTYASNSPDFRAAAAAALPNAIQSLDAAHMHLAVERLADIGVPVATIHDCILFPANDAPLVSSILRDTFVETHERPFLWRIADVVEQKTGKRLDPPKPGGLDLNEVRSNPFFFS